MNIVVLDKSTLGEVKALEELTSFGEVSFYATTSPDEVVSRIAHADVVITNKVVIDENIMKSSPNLKLICVAATGINNIDLDAAERFGITVKNVAGYSTKSVAQHTFTLLLALVGQLSYYDNYVKEGAYANSPIFTHIDKPYWELSGKVMGIIGLGNIGREVANVAKAFGMEVVYYSTSGKNSTSDYKRVGLNELLSLSDVVTIHAPLNDATKNLIDTKELRMMKASAILLNNGRGGIINEEALIKALNNKIIYAAGLDVLEQEPIRQKHSVVNLEDPSRLIITPHIAWASQEARETLVQGIISNIKSHSFDSV